MDNNFSSILTGIELGRLVFANLKKVILYLLPAGSWSELLPILGKSQRCNSYTDYEKLTFYL